MPKHLIDPFGKYQVISFCSSSLIHFFFLISLFQPYHHHCHHEMSVYQVLSTVWRVFPGSFHLIPIPFFSSTRSLRFPSSWAPYSLLYDSHGRIQPSLTPGPRTILTLTSLSDGAGLAFCSPETRCPPHQRAGRAAPSQEAEQTGWHGPWTTCCLPPRHLVSVLLCLGSAIQNLQVMASLTHPGLPSS